MTSQSPESETAAEADEYLAAWEALSHLIMEEGGSWSGREKNCAYLNLGNGRFANVSPTTSADYPDDARAVAVLDWDQDGRLDLVLKNRTGPRLRLLHNRSTDNNPWLRLRLRGTGASNRDAIGSLVTLTLADGKRLVQSVHGGDGYLSQSTKTLHFGLGDGSEIQGLQVRWPDGQVEEFPLPDTRKQWLLVQGSGVLSEQARPALARFAGLDPSPASLQVESSHRIVLADRLPMAEVPLPAYENAARKVGDLSGGPVLINMWGTWCVGCQKELAEFKQSAAELSAAGLRIIAISNDEADQQDLAQKRITTFGLQDAAGPATAEYLKVLALLYDELLGANAPSVLPTSLLLDDRGQLCVIYQGPVEPAQLLSDVAALRRAPATARFTGTLQEGRWLSVRVRDFAGLANGLRQAGLNDLAAYYTTFAERDAERHREAAGG